MATKIRLLGVKCGQILFSPPCSPPENLCLSEKNTKTCFFLFFYFIFLVRVCIAPANRDQFYMKGAQLDEE